ncbi:hypothetical protein GCM10010300_80990 [Streptomyces olivaceoviridis]|nr:hypothetical protein GCM10010300_80990 [Streptomyces olivaceoviridis]
MSARRPYRSDVSDARWALIEPVFSAWRARRTGPGTAARVHDLREIVNAILYVNRTGIPWEYPPHDFPPYKTVYDYYAKWEADGTTQQVHDLLRDKARRAHGRSAEPTAAVVDAQSVNLGKRRRDQPGHRRRQEDQRAQAASDHGHARSGVGRPGHRRERARHHRRQTSAR